MNDILINNEEAFKKRYGSSLRSGWVCLEDAARKEYIQEVTDYDRDCAVDSIKFERDTILRIILGFGGINSLERITENALPVSRIVIWEPQEAVFEAACTQSDISDIIADPRITIVLGSDLTMLKAALKENIYDNNAYHSKIIAVGRYARHDDKRVSELTDILTEISGDSLQDAKDRKFFGKLPCENMLYTIRHLYESAVISQLFNMIPMRDIPVIIVAAGPSLTKNCDELKRAKGRAVIVAVAHAMKTLNAHGIIPDLVALTDPVATDFLSFKDSDKYTLLCSVYADKACRKENRGGIIYYGFNTFRDLFITDRTAEEEFAEMDTGSVATDMFSLFSTAGFSHIILTGQDLAYDEMGYTHAGNENENSDYEKNKAFLETEGIFGGKVRTRADWERFRRYFEKKIEENKGILVTDATEGGALIHGSEIMRLSDAIDIYCKKEYPVDKWICGLKKGDEKEKEYIEGWLTAGLSDAITLDRYLEEAIKTNEYIRTLWNKRNMWDNDFTASCKRYDILYDKIMNGESGALLRHYCISVLQNYVESALIYEGDENAEQRMKLEYDLFVFMKKKTKALFDYIGELIG